MKLETAFKYLSIWSERHTLKIVLHIGPGGDTSMESGVIVKDEADLKSFGEMLKVNKKSVK